MLGSWLHLQSACLTTEDLTLIPSTYVKMADMEGHPFYPNSWGGREEDPWSFLASQSMLFGKFQA